MIDLNSAQSALKDAYLSAASNILNTQTNPLFSKINQSSADYTVLVYLGYIMYNQEKQGKTMSSFALMILNNFMCDLYGDN